MLMPTFRPARMRWAVAATWTYASDVAQVDFTGLGIYDEVMVVPQAITGAGAELRYVRVSVDNGGAFLEASGDYLKIDNAGVETALTAMNIHSTVSASARGGPLWLMGMRSNQHKVAVVTSGNEGRYRVVTTSPINAVRFFVSGNNITGGGIVLYGR